VATKAGLTVTYNRGCHYGGFDCIFRFTGSDSHIGSFTFFRSGTNHEVLIDKPVMEVGIHKFFYAGNKTAIMISNDRAIQYK
jgi:hypothetical protein